MFNTFAVTPANIENLSWRTASSTTPNPRSADIGGLGVRFQLSCPLVRAGSLKSADISALVRLFCKQSYKIGLRTQRFFIPNLEISNLLGTSCDLPQATAPYPRSAMRFCLAFSLCASLSAAINFRPPAIPLITTGPFTQVRMRASTSTGCNSDALGWAN